MTHLADWIRFGRAEYQHGRKALERRWLNEARYHIPHIDRRGRA